MKRKVFYSFHYKKDNWRVQQIRNMGILEGNQPVSPNQWEKIKQKGDRAIEEWIDENLKRKSCLIVLIGEETANRQWVQYEINKAWGIGKGVLGIYIHNLKNNDTKKSKKGENPFDKILLGDKKLSEIVKDYDPDSKNPYKDIEDNIEKWIEESIQIRANFQYQHNL